MSSYVNRYYPISLFSLLIGTLITASHFHMHGARALESAYQMGLLQTAAGPAEAPENTADNSLFGNILSSLTGDEKTVSLEDTTFTGQNYSKLPWKNSIMFDQARLEQLYRALARHRGTGDSESRRAEVDASARVTINAEGSLFDAEGNVFGAIAEDGSILDATGEKIGQVDADGFIVHNDGRVLGIDTRVKGVSTIAETPSVAPAFYFNSSLFYSPKSWTIWLNSQKIRKGKELKDLTVVNIQEDFVDIIWKPLDLNFISPEWKSKVVPILGYDVSTELGIPISEEDVELLNELAKKPRNTDVPVATAQNEQMDYADVEEVSVENTKEEAVNATANTANMDKNKVEDKQTAEPPVASIEAPEQAELAELDLPELGDIFEDKTPKEEEVKADEEEAKKEEEEKRLIKKSDAVFSNQGVDEALYNWAYKSRDGNILIDNDSGVVKFRLGVNQSFVSHTLEIAEGFVQETVLSVAAQQQQGEEISVETIESEVFDYSN